MTRARALYISSVVCVVVITRRLTEKPEGLPPRHPGGGLLSPHAMTTDSPVLSAYDGRLPGCWCLPRTAHNVYMLPGPRAGSKGGLHISLTRYTYTAYGPARVAAKTGIWRVNGTLPRGGLDVAVTHARAETGSDAWWYGWDGDRGG